MNKFVRLPRLPLGVMVDKHSQLARRWCIWFSLTTEAGIMRLSGMGLKELALPRKTYSVAFINKFHKASPKTVFLPFSNSRSVYNDQDFLLISQPKAAIEKLSN